MNISDDDLLSIIDDATQALGQILLNHRELSESLLDTQQTDRAKEKIDTLRKKIEDERENLASTRQTQQRKKELERIRQSHAKEANEAKETKQKIGTVALQNQKGQVVAWIQTIGKNRVNIMNAKGKVIAREIDGRTFNERGEFRGYGKQGLRVLGMNLKRTYSN